MVLERYLTETVTKHFGHFVEGLDTDQVRLSAWKGEINLQNLKIRKNALDSLFQGRPVKGGGGQSNTNNQQQHASPFEIAYGTVGNLQVSIPWNVLRTQLMWTGRTSNAASSSSGGSASKSPVSIVLTDVSLLITPRCRESSSTSGGNDTGNKENGECKDDKEGDADEIQTPREEEIQEALDAELLKRATESSSDEEKKSWIQDRLASLLENLSVTVRNIHVRYEDNGHSMGFQWSADASRVLAGMSTSPGDIMSTPIHRYRPAFCVGITLKEFSIKATEPSADNKIEASPTPVASNEDTATELTAVRKVRVASAEALAIYWDSDVPLMSEVAIRKRVTGRDFFESAFQTLRSGPSSRGWSSQNGFAPQHSFVLDPFSPSITIRLAPNPSNNYSNRRASTLTGSLPPCRFSVSRNLLEDLGYLRKSYAVWRQSNSGHFSEATLRRLAGLRPARSPLKDPRGWWNYILEAITIMNREEALKSRSDLSKWEREHRRPGWLGVARLLAIRKKYLAAYETLVTSESKDAKSTANNQLVELESWLDLPEIVAFRIHCYSWLRDNDVMKDVLVEETKSKNLGRWAWVGQRQSSRVEENAVIATSNSEEVDGTDQAVTVRLRSLYEMGQALDKEKSNGSTQIVEDYVDPQDLPYGLDDSSNPLTWTADISCGEISLQVNDRRMVHRHRDKTAPVVRLACAFSQEQRIFRDGSWTYKLGIGSLRVRDCTLRRTGVKVFPYLIGPKRGHSFEGERVSVDAKEHDRIVSLIVSRSQHAFRSAALGSTTTSEIRVLPLEICYLTTPVEAVSRILNTANVDFADDYQRISSSLFAWRERQKKRLLAALSQQNKQIIVHIDLWAPTIYVPEGEDSSSPIILVDLGHLAFSNDDGKQTHVSSLTDHWRLSLTQIQVQCTNVGNITQRSTMGSQAHKYQQVVEPFSLNFAVTTRFHRQETDSLVAAQDQILVMATLPRLVFNLNASVVRLLRRLQSQWNQRKLEIQSSFLLPSRVFGGLAGSHQARSVPSSSKERSSGRLFQFRFVAPLLRLQFENDVDGRDCKFSGDRQESTSTPILDLSLRGIEGEVVNERVVGGHVRHSFQAKLRSIDAKDMYQRYCDKFCWLLSSISPETLNGAADGRESFASATDLVSVRYTASDHEGATGKEAESDHGSNRLSIHFHELFIEWNPETIAAIFHAIQGMPESSMPEDQESASDDDEFFEAEEDEFQSVGSVASDDDGSDSHLISEISSHRSSYADLSEMHSLSTQFPPPSSKFFISPSQQNVLGGLSHLNKANSAADFVKTKRMEVEFELSKLRINFNKETRCRRVFTAEVDHTSVKYATRKEGGYRSKIILGNLTLTDPQSDFDSTLYREIMGLKGDTVKSVGENSSLLEMSMVKNPRVRRFVDHIHGDWGEDTTLTSSENHVTVDLSHGLVHGCDLYLSAALSPMRFVYLQQLWFEIVDYMFEGVLGYEVWGKKRPVAGDDAKFQSEEAQAEAVTYTSFEISMQSPVILVPVTYCSTDFIRLETESILISNNYNYRPPRIDGVGNDAGQLQWYNNCSLKMSRIILSNWGGSVLNQMQDSVNCTVLLDWPTGPLAARIKPKWKVNCSFDELRLSLPKEDYALLQHIISTNMSEPSKHLEEWNSLQSLPAEIRDSFEKSTFVAFGYDKKDVTPSTFDVAVTIPLLQFDLRECKHGLTGVAQCKDVVWKYQKFADLVSRQHVACEISLVGKDGDEEKLMLSSHDNLFSTRDENALRPRLVYKSITTPSGDIEKELVIGNGCIHVGYRPWRRFANFFSQLPTPSYLSPNEVIQVGDRWYRISDGRAGDDGGRRESPSLDWISELGCGSDISPTPVSIRRDPLYKFHLQLDRPRIALKSVDSALILALENISLQNDVQSGLIERQINLSGVEFQTMSQHNQRMDRDASLINPLDIQASMRLCNGSNCKCSTHSSQVNVGMIKATAAFSDLVRLALVLIQLKKDIKEVDGALKSPRNPARDEQLGDKATTQPLEQGPGTSLSVDFEGLEVSLVDDSGRHFAHAQELFLLTIRHITYLVATSFSVPHPERMERSTTLALRDLRVIDALQSDVSPFRTVLRLNEGDSFESVLSSAEISSLKMFGGDVERGVEISQFVASNSSKYTFGIHHVEMQYNPSMVVALQRFLGRLYKTIGKKVRQPHENSADLLSISETSSQAKASSINVEATVHLKKASISLNKEHQGRCLLDINLANVNLSAEQTEYLTRLKGVVGFFSALDANDFDLGKGMLQDNRPIVKMRKDKDRFLEFEYKSFPKKLFAKDFDSSGLPTWVLNYTQEQGSEIDDYLDLAIASVEVVYLSSRTSELVDYLSNGLPGKGMGATSRAAKGFVAERIQKKSFLQINVDAPIVLVPRNEFENVGLVFGGEVRARSWIQISDATRKLSIAVGRLYAGVYFGRFQKTHQPILSNVDVTIDVSRDVSDNTSLVCCFSDLFARLSYSDYYYLVNVVRDNIGRKIDKTKWDNVEAAWEYEASSEISSYAGESPRGMVPAAFSMDVAYSSDARHIRYGQGRQRDNSRRATRFEVTVALNDLSLVLRRDKQSSLPGFEPYDMMLFRAQGFEASLTSVEDGSSASFSIHRVFLFDTGSRGRQLQRATSLTGLSEDSVVVLVEGYAAPQMFEKQGQDKKSSQLIIRIDTSRVLDASDYRISVVLNHLSVAALVPPFQELSQFLKLEWSTSKSEALDDAALDRLRSNESQHFQTTLTQPPTREKKRYHIQLVLHYPQFIFAATEEDIHSRALVLRGLAILKGSQTAPPSDPNGKSLNVNADFQNVSSHIVPDAAEILCIASRHYDIVTECLPEYAGVYHQDGRRSTTEKVDEIGVALLLPVTVGIEFEEVVSSSENIGTKRSFALNMDPLSVLLSAEDLHLIRSLVSRWASPKKSISQKADVSMRHFEVMFNTDRLGLGLRRESRDIIVDAAREDSCVCIGDILYSINGALLSESAALPLSGVVERLREESRPLRLGFIRKDPEIAETLAEPPSDLSVTKRIVTTTADLSFSEATITLTDQDVSLLRGKIVGTRISYNRKESDDLTQKVSFLSTISLDYYNLRIWQWEPLLEPGSLHASAEYTDPHLGPKSIALELGDRDAYPLAINLTDACTSALSKFREWAYFSDDASIERVAFADRPGQAANVALQFAKRQKHNGGKPYVFQNKCGLSCAFAVQKRGVESRRRRQALSLLGEYRGLNSYTDSEVYVVAPDSDYKFRVDRPSGGRRNDGQDRRPCLTVAFQSVVGMMLDPICDLQMVRPGENLVALSYKITDDRGDGAVTSVWLSWKVEVTDEKTILTLGSSFRVSSQLRTIPIEVGVEQEDGRIRSLGFTPENEDLHLPLWLSVKSQFQLHVKPAGQYEFAPLFEFCARNQDENESSRSTRYIQCVPTRTEDSSIWLASRMIKKGSVAIVSIDCCLTLLNLLPTPLHWEVSVGVEKYRQTFDGSTHREGPIQVGKFAEVLGSHHGSLFLRLRSSYDWSNWVVLASANTGKDSHFQNIALKDTFGVPLVVGLRTTRQTIGLQVTFYAETWFLNATRLNVSFGAPSDFVFPVDDVHAAISGFEEMSAAEAALKEFSALFETGEGGKDLRKERQRQNEEFDICLLPGHAGTVVTEECYEYIEVDSSVVKRRWWGSEDPGTNRPNLTSLVEDGENWHWVDNKWLLDNTRKTPDSWSSAPRLNEFRNLREFDPSHRYRRRRWYRRRQCYDGITTAFSQGVRAPRESRNKRKADSHSTDLRFALRVEGGRWAMTSRIPAQGVVYGAVRAASTRARNQSDRQAGSTEVYELCYSVQPLEGEWGALSRLMIVSSRFLVRNDSNVFTFEVKQVGCPDSSARLLSPGGNCPFHWSDLRLPALICVRPLAPDLGTARHKWSGGFDPLTIGVTPVRIREIGSSGVLLADDIGKPQIKSLKVEAAIRPRSGGAGINISFKEEDETGQGSLFRIDNCTPFPIWFSQDGMLVNPASSSGWHAEGDMLRPSRRMPFALDVPFRQGKYSHRREASIEELLRVRLSLAPLNSRAGIEATRVVSLATVGETVRLNPSKLSILNRSSRAAMQNFRIIGVVTNDGPTRVLNLVMMRKEDALFTNPFKEEIPALASKGALGEVGPYAGEIIAGVESAVALIREDDSSVPTQEVAIKTAMAIVSVDDKSENAATERQMIIQAPEEPAPRDLIVSLRISLGGFTLSLIDSAPSEIASITLRNVNAIASWNTARRTDSTIYLTVAHIQVDNYVPNAPYPVALCAVDHLRAAEKGDLSRQDATAPLLVVGVSLAPYHRSGVEVIKSITIAPKNLAIRVDLAFLVRLQKFFFDLQKHLRGSLAEEDGIAVPNLSDRIAEIEAAARSGEHSRMYYFGGLTILPCSIQLSVAPARALSPIQASLEGAEAAAIHQAVKKGDLKLGDDEVLLGVKIGHRNDTPLAVVRGVFKSIVVDALLRLDGASLNFSGISLTNHVATGPQIATYVAAHYMNSLRKNVPALVGSLAALGNPVGLVRGLGDGVSDFVLEPVKGFQRSVQEMDASYLVDGVARGTLSLARHTVGGFANSAAALAETFSKNMTVLALDRRYAQKRDRGDDLRTHQGDMNVALGLGSGVQKLVHGFLEGVTGVVKAPIRGAEKRGLEGFAKGVGKGLLGLLVKPLVGISDGLTDVMIGVKGSVDGASGGQSGLMLQIRPRRPVYGRDRAIRPYNLADAAALALMQRTRLAGELYLSHLDMGDRLALLSVKRILLMGPLGEELLVLKYKHIERAEMRAISLADGSPGWGIILVLNTPRRNGSEVEVINCREQWQASALLSHIEEGIRLCEMSSSSTETAAATAESIPPYGSRNRLATF